MWAKPRAEVFIVPFSVRWIKQLIDSGPNQCAGEPGWRGGRVVGNVKIAPYL